MAFTVAGRSRRPLGGGRYAGAEILTFSDEDDNDQDKTFDFTTDVLGAAANASHCEVLWVYIEYVAAAVAGTRFLTCDIRDSADDVVGGFGAANDVDNGETRQLMFGQELDAAQNTEPDQERLPSNLILFPGMDMNFTASNSNAADDMHIHIQLAAYS